MATSLRKQSPSLKEQLFQSPYEFEYSQAVMLLENLYTDKNAVATTPRADQEAVRLRGNINLSTPPSDLYSLEKPRNKLLPATLTLNFMGIAGQTGPLPNVYGELILDRVKRKDYAFRDFLDVFNNRLSGIHYRIRVKHTIGLTRQQPLQTEMAQMLQALSGQMSGQISSQISEKVNATQDSNGSKNLIPARSYLKYAGLLYQKPHSATGLEVILKDYFQMPFKVEQFQGFWTLLEKDQCTRLGRPTRGPYKGKDKSIMEQQNALGQTAALGSKAWIHGEKLTLSVEGLDLDTYLDMLPGRPQNKRISEMARHYLGREQFFDFKIALSDDQATATKLDGKSALGWTSWLKEASKDYVPKAIHVKADDPSV